MEQPLSVALTAEPFLALPWLPPRSAGFIGAASFIRFALRARRTAYPKTAKAKPSCMATPSFFKARMIGALEQHAGICRSSERAARGRNGTKRTKYNHCARG